VHIYFVFFIQSKTGTGLSFNSTARRATVKKLLRRETQDFITAPNLLLPTVSYGLLKVPQEQVCQQPVRDVDELR